VTSPSDGKRYVLVSDLNVEPGGHLVMAYRGLPQPSPWWLRAQIAIGVAVLALIAWAAVGIFGRRARAAALADGERDLLFAELVTVERELRAREGGGRDKKLDARRAELIGRLTQIAAREEDART
jgi:hypothetical protein